MSEEPASETGNYRTSCNCCKTGSHMREFMLLYVSVRVCEYISETCVCVTGKREKGDDGDAFQGVVTAYLTSCQTATPPEQNLNSFDAADSCILQNDYLPTTLLKSICTDQKKFSLFGIQLIRLFSQSVIAVVFKRRHPWPVYILHSCL